MFIKKYFMQDYKTLYCINTLLQMHTNLYCKKLKLIKIMGYSFNPIFRRWNVNTWKFVPTFFSSPGLQGELLRDVTSVYISIFQSASASSREIPAWGREGIKQTRAQDCHSGKEKQEYFKPTYQLLLNNISVFVL